MYRAGRLRRVFRARGKLVGTSDFVVTKGYVQIRVVGFPRSAGGRVVWRPRGSRRGVVAGLFFRIECQSLAEIWARARPLAAARVIDEHFVEVMLWLSWASAARRIGDRGLQAFAPARRRDSNVTPGAR